MAAETVFILGAGFSKNAGIPLQSEFTESVRKALSFARGRPSRLIVEQADKFISDVFHVGLGETWPQWEDVFTFLDLSANSGHHLGVRNEPSRLRSLRRAFLARIIRMLDQAYKSAAGSTDQSVQDDLQGLDKFLGSLDLPQSAFVSLNWDDVLERRLETIAPGIAFDYGSHVKPALFLKSNRCTLVPMGSEVPMSVPVVKMHGAVNWLYCDACRLQLSFSPGESGYVAQQIMRRKDWQALGVKKGIPPVGLRRCPFCAVILGTRIATFSYRKALDSPILVKAWFLAEDILRDAVNWVFVGYSLPDADYEFKYLLKRVELSRPSPPRLFVIDKCPQTLARFRRFYGTRLPDRATCLDGVGEAALQILRNAGVIGSP